MNRKNGISINKLMVWAVLIIFALAGCVETDAGSSETDSGENQEEVSSQEDASAGTEGGGADQGQTIYSGLCVACHGPDAKGVSGLGKDLVESKFVDSLSDEELVAFIAEGRPAYDPANTTGIDMPARGGISSLTDEDLASVVAYLRTLTD